MKKFRNCLKWAELLILILYKYCYKLEKTEKIFALLKWYGIILNIVRYKKWISFFYLKILK